MLPIRTILFPTDMSEHANAAFRLAASLARDYGARLILLTVYPPPFNKAEEVDRTRPDGIEDDLLARLRELKADPTLKVECQVKEGDAAETILAVAAESRADLIVMGTHGRSGLSRLLMGSVAEAVNRKASCPVMTVRGMLRLPGEPDSTPGPVQEDDPSREVTIPIGPINLRGTLRWAGKPNGVVVFAHGSGSSRHSPRNRFVAEVLNNAGFATLLMDLLTEEESQDRENVFDIALLADRLAGAAEWLAGVPEMAGLPIGYFGASTGSAAALMAAASHSHRVSAVVSRGGRPDLAWDDLPVVGAPTLLIVGGDDQPVLTWNQEALERLRCPKELVVVPGATHLFEEPGTLETVADLARDWFARRLKAGTRPDGRGTR